MWRDLKSYKSSVIIIKMYSLLLLQHLKTLTGHTGGVWCSQFDGSTIVSGSTDRTLRVRPTVTEIILQINILVI